MNLRAFAILMAGLAPAAGGMEAVRATPVQGSAPATVQDAERFIDALYARYRGHPIEGRRRPWAGPVWWNESVYTAWMVAQSERASTIELRKPDPASRRRSGRDPPVRGLAEKLCSSSGRSAPPAWRIWRRRSASATMVSNALCGCFSSAPAPVGGSATCSATTSHKDWRNITASILPGWSGSRAKTLAVEAQRQRGHAGGSEGQLRDVTMRTERDSTFLDSAETNYRVAFAMLPPVLGGTIPTFGLVNLIRGSFYGWPAFSSTGCASRIRFRSTSSSSWPGRSS